MGSTMIYKLIPKRFLQDKDGYPTSFAWRIYDIEVFLKMRKPIEIAKGPYKFMWGDKEITGIKEITIDYDRKD